VYIANENFIAYKQAGLLSVFKNVSLENPTGISRVHLINNHL